MGRDSARLSNFPICGSRFGKLDSQLLGCYPVDSVAFRQATGVEQPAEQHDHGHEEGAARDRPTFMGMWRCPTELKGWTNTQPSVGPPT